MNDNIVDDFNTFRHDIIQQILIDEEIAIRSKLERQYKYQKKSAKFIKAECKKELDSIRERLEYGSSTFELLLEVIKHVSKDVSTETSNNNIEEMQHRIARAINSVNSFD